MTTELINQLLCSTIKVDKRATYYGNARIKELAVLSMIYDLISCDNLDISHSCLLKLNNLAQRMINSSPDICHLRGDTVFFGETQLSTPILVTLNHAPSVDDAAFTMPDEGSAFHTFAEADFKINFTDEDGDLPDLVRIVSLPGIGTLRYNNQIITEGFLFNIEDASNLTYERPNYAYSSSFVFQTSDNNAINKLFSNMANFVITVDGEINQPPTIGDGAETTAYNTTIVFTRAMFTTSTTPPYSDPEGDAALTLKITSLPAQGNIKLSGVNISVNDEFDFTTDIDSGNLTYVPDPGITTSHMPSFTFEIADAGSGQFVS